MAITGERSVEIDAPREHVYRVLAEFDAYPEWQKAVKSAETLERDEHGDTLLADLRQDAMVKEVHLVVRVTDQDEPNGFGFHQERGDVKSMRGWWRLDDLGDGRTHVTYHLEIDPGFALGLLLKGPVVDRVKNHTLDGTLSDLKTRAESTKP